MAAPAEIRPAEPGGRGGDGWPHQRPQQLQIAGSWPGRDRPRLRPAAPFAAPGSPLQPPAAAGIPVERRRAGEKLATRWRPVTGNG